MDVMTYRNPLAALMPLFASLFPYTAAAQVDRDEVLTVTGSALSPATENASGAGFKTPEIELGPLGTRAWIDTPYSSTTVTQPMIKNQQAKSVAELLKYSPSTQMQARGGMDVGRPQSRGMQGSVVANSRLDGLNIVSTTAFPVEMLERLDVLNSLTGALYGPASPAGQFNFVAKRPTPQPLREVTFGYQSRSAFSGHVDLGGHLDDDNTFGYRINALNEEGKAALTTVPCAVGCWPWRSTGISSRARSCSWTPAITNSCKRATPAASAMGRMFRCPPPLIRKINTWCSRRRATI